GSGPRRSGMPAASRWSRDRTDPTGGRARAVVIWITEGRGGPCYAVTNSFMLTRRFHMRMRPTHGVAVVFAAALAATVGSSGPAQAFFFLPMFQQQQPSQPEGRSGRSSGGDNYRWKRDRGSDDDAEPAKPSGGTRVKRNEEKSSSSSSSSGKSGKSQAKSESSSSPAPRTRSVRQEPPPSKSSGRSRAAGRRESPAS